MEEDFMEQPKPTEEVSEMQDQPETTLDNQV